jgi:hypothetical protein
VFNIKCQGPGRTRRWPIHEFWRLRLAALRRQVGVGILGTTFRMIPSIQRHGWARSASEVVPGDPSGFGDLRRVRSNTSFERKRSTTSAKLKQRRPGRSTQPLDGNAPNGRRRRFVDFCPSFASG